MATARLGFVAGVVLFSVCSVGTAFAQTGTGAPQGSPAQPAQPAQPAIPPQAPPPGTETGSEAVDPTEMPVQDPNAPATEPAGAERERPGLLTDDQALMEERHGRQEFRDTTSPSENEDENYFFLGLFYRHTFIPSFLLDLFLEESTSASNPGFGVEFTYRKNGFDIVGSLWYSGLTAYGPFRASGDPATDVEMIDSSLGAIYASAAFLWSTNFNDMFALEYGVDVGLGVLFGDLIRTEAYPDQGGFRPCMSPGNPATDSEGNPLAPGYCDEPAVGDGEEGAHYGVKARKWSDGGKVPNVLPWLALPHLALRIKPIHQLMIRIEGGVGLGFFMGGSVNYGF